MKTQRVNKETGDGYFFVEIFNPIKNEWEYITTEFSISVASIIMNNLFNATKHKCRVIDIINNDTVLAQIELIEK